MKRLQTLVRRLCIQFACLQAAIAVCLGQGIITTYVGDGFPGQLAFPEGIAVDAVRNLYIADTRHQRILRVATDGVMSTFAHRGLMRFPTSIALDATGNAIITETFALGDR
jgi:serine/threonine-protein kinase